MRGCCIFWSFPQESDHEPAHVCRLILLDCPCKAASKHIISFLLLLSPTLPSDYVSCQSARARKPESRVRRARQQNVSAAIHRWGAHEGVDGEQDVDGDPGMHMERSDLSPFLREIVSMSSPPGPRMTAMDILHPHHVYVEDGEEFEVDEENARYEQLLAGPLLNAELVLERNASRQVRTRLNLLGSMDRSQRGRKINSFPPL